MSHDVVIYNMLLFVEINFKIRTSFVLTVSVNNGAATQTPDPFMCADMILIDVPDTSPYCVSG